MTTADKQKSLTDDYQNSGFLGNLGFGRSPALIIVDMVQAYFEPSSPLFAPLTATLEAAIRVLIAARAAKIPIVFTCVEYQAGGVDGGQFYRKVKALRVFDKGSPLGRFAAGLVPLPEEVVVTKQYASAFFGTSLAAMLTTRKVDTTIIVGVTTSGCVRATAVDALQNGFVPVVVREAVGDRDPRPHEANLFDLQAKYADVVSERDIIERLQRQATGAA